MYRSWNGCSSLAEKLTNRDEKTGRSGDLIAVIKLASLKNFLVTSGEKSMPEYKLCYNIVYIRVLFHNNGISRSCPTYDNLIISMVHVYSCTYFGLKCFGSNNHVMVVSPKSK